MLADLDKYSDRKSSKTFVMEAGITTQDNLALVREKGYQYVCVSRKRLKDVPT